MKKLLITLTAVFFTAFAQAQGLRLNPLEYFERQGVNVLVFSNSFNGVKLSDVEHVDLIFRGISDLDSNSLNYIKGCKKLSLSSNIISKIPDLHFDNLEILSLGRNKIR